MRSFFDESGCIEQDLAFKRAMLREIHAGSEHAIVGVYKSRKAFSPTMRSYIGLAPRSHTGSPSCECADIG